MRGLIRRSGGFTLIEIVIVLAIIAILAGILAPTLTRYVGDSKIRRAEGDVQRIAVAMGAFYSDVGEWPLWATGTATTPAATKFKALQGTGDNPTLTGAGWPGFTDVGTSYIAGDNVDDLKDQLISNAPSYPTTGKRPWRGPYLDDIKTDPWGSKYLVNVEFLQPANVSGAKPVFVLSPGPDKEVDTSNSQTGPDLVVSDDDIVFRIK